MSKSIETKVHLLKLVDYHHPILRKKTAKVHFPLSEEDKQIIQNMQYSIQTEQLKKANAPWDAAVGMAANQWGIDKQIFLYHEEDTDNFRVVINPSYEPIGKSLIDKKEFSLGEEVCAWEACFSVPLAFGNVKRYKKIKAYYQNELGESITLELSDWPARVWQHETDHLQGFLYDDPVAEKCLHKKRFSSKEEALQFRGDLKAD